MEEGKPITRALFWGLLAFLLWMLIAPRLFPPPPGRTPGASQPGTVRTDSGQTDSGQTDSGQTDSGQTATTRQASPGGETTAAIASQPEQQGGIAVVGGTESGPVVLGEARENGPWRMQVVCSPRGASIERLLLSDFALELHSKERYELLDPVYDPVLGLTHNSLAVERIRLIQQQRDIDLTNVIWTKQVVRDKQQHAVAFEVVLKEEGQDLLKIVRRYRLEAHPIDKRRHADPERLRHDLDIFTTVQNLSGQQQDVILVLRGPTGLRREGSRYDTRVVLAANGPLDQPEFEKERRADVAKEAEKILSLTNPELPFLYTALTNKFFTTVLFPVSLEDGPADGSGDKSDGMLANVEAFTLLGAQELDELHVHNRSDLSVRFTTKPLAVPVEKSVTLAFDGYFGPKSKVAFEQLKPYQQRNYYQMVEAEYYWCAWPPLTRLMIAFFQWIYGFWPHNYGLAIIILVFIVRALLHPITKSGQKSMMRMQQKMTVMQPKMEEIKKKYGSDKTKLNQEMMKLYQDEGVSPAGQFMGCLPMFFQMPVWGALWTALAFAVEMRHQGFIFWIRDLTAPDALITFSSTVKLPLLGPTNSFNVLPILLGISMFFQQKFMPKPHKEERDKRKTDQQAQQQKMMMWMMTIMMTLIFYNAPSGLTLYIMASTAAGIVEQWRIRKHLREEEKAGHKPKKPGWLKKPKFFNNLQKLAEEARKQQYQTATKSKSQRK